ncbi:GntR family transcriptional regulator [Paenibacillus beijingensis]|uniref:GntR family transcriptional regulator n=1 Tax=Paenibacillus beijingensis TaxID=1126833 RepID=A0A0D5NGW0_9BACL|nr:GntR family transcriptional regulator [Paenibacillus beijingensis]
MNSEFRFSIKKTDTLRNQIYQDIKDAVIGGQLKPGQRLREQDLSNDMGVSRGPIREAILLLEREGLLVTQTHRETTVAQVEKEEVDGLLNPLRLLLESFCIQKIISLLSDEHFSDLDNILNDLIDACKNQDLGKVVKKDLQFHEYLVSLTEEPYLISLWSGVSSRIVFHFMNNSQIHQQNDFSLFISEHVQLLNAIKTKDWSNIEPVLRKHIY